MDIIFYFIVFAVLGVAHEVFWTSVIDSIRDRNLRFKGRSSLWMFPIYGAIFFIVLIGQEFFPDVSLFIRGFLYMILIYSWEYITGYFIRLFVGNTPWDYSSNSPEKYGKKKFHLHGLICLEYAPIWFIEGLLAEWLYLFIKAHWIF